MRPRQSAFALLGLATSQQCVASLHAGISGDGFGFYFALFVGILFYAAIWIGLPVLLVVLIWRSLRRPVPEASQMPALVQTDFTNGLPEEQLGSCPNCDAAVPLRSGNCPKCSAYFGHGSAWSVKSLNGKGAA